MSRRYCPLKKAHYNRKVRYQLTPEAYYELLSKQKGRCAICNNVAVLVVDHEHVRKKKVRGLLCNACNFMLGQAKDNIDVLKSAIKYLRKHGK